MENIPIIPYVGSFFTTIPNGAKKILTDRKKYYLENANILQESCEVYNAGNTTGILFTFRDYGVCDIHQVGFTLILETNHHKYAFQKTYASVSYKNDNQFVVHIIDLQRLPIKNCSLVFNWISYSNPSSESKEESRREFGVAFTRPKKKNLEYIRAINKVRENCLSDPNRLSLKKSDIPEEQIRNAWMSYEQLISPFSKIQELIQIVKSKPQIINLRETATSANEEKILVPISCYFDKGFYSTIYYAQRYTIVEKRLTSGRSAIQCVIEVEKSHLDMLLYLYYCTISQRGYFQYMTDEQKYLQKFLWEHHPIMLLQKQIEDIEMKFHGSEIVMKSFVIEEAQNIIENYYRLLQNIREDTYAMMVKEHQTHGKWVNEFKLYILIKVLFPDAVYQYSVDWLEGQVLDIFIPSANCAIEYQGEQHYANVEYFGGENHLVEQETMDEEKRKKCKKNNVLLLEWPYSLKINVSTICKFLGGSVSEQYLTEKNYEEQVSCFPINSLSELLSVRGKYRKVGYSVDKTSSRSRRSKKHSNSEIRKYDKYGVFIRSYESVAEAAEQEQLSIGGISKVIYGERKTAGGFQWRRCDKNSAKDDISAIEI